MQILIRDFVDGDEAAVVAILREMQGAELPFNPHMKPVLAIGPWYVAMLKAQASSSTSAFLVAEVEGNCVGLAFVLLNEIELGEGELQAYSHAHVTELGVLASARGQGVGMALLRDCEARAKAAGKDEITLAVYCANGPAHNLYLKAGFADFKVRMRKSIG